MRPHDRRAAFDCGIVDGFRGVASQLDSIALTNRPVYWRGYSLGADLVARLVAQLSQAQPLAVASLPGMPPSRSILGELAPGDGSTV